MNSLLFSLPLFPLPFQNQLSHLPLQPRSAHAQPPHRGPATLSHASLPPQSNPKTSPISSLYKLIFSTKSRGALTIQSKILNFIFYLHLHRESPGRKTHLQPLSLLPRSNHTLSHNLVLTSPSQISHCRFTLRPHDPNLRTPQPFGCDPTSTPASSTTTSLPDDVSNHVHHPSQTPPLTTRPPLPSHPTDVATETRHPPPCISWLHRSPLLKGFRQRRFGLQG